jgi:hypothetical protein
VEVAEVFANYEVNRVPRWPVMLRLVGASVVFHAICAACVVYVPAVRDAVNVAAMFSGASYVDKAYQKTNIADLQLIELPREKFHYPEGYFAVASDLPVSVASPTPSPLPTIDPDAPTVVSQSGSEPRLRRNRRAGIDPAPTLSASPEVATASPAQPSPDKNASSKAETAAASPTPLDEKAKQELDAKMDKVAVDAGVERPKDNEINKRPLKDMLAKAKQMKDEGKLDLSGAIEMTIEADRDDTGKLKNAKVVTEKGDPRLSDVAKEFAAALSDSNVLYFLKGTDHLRLTLKLDQDTVAVSMATEVDSAERARQMASGYNTLLALGIRAKQGQDEEVYYKNTKVSSSDKQVIVSFSMARKAAGDMLSKYAAEVSKG